MRSTMITKILEDCNSTTVAGPSADWFENDPNVNIIYIKHEISLGFVTYKKKWGRGKFQEPYNW